jgi:glycosyltransferase involved in cell wall biosynthesis
VSSLPEVGGDAVLYFDPMSVTSMSAALQSVLDDTELADELRRRGPRLAAQFSWEKTASGVLQAVEAVGAPVVR